MLFCLKQLMSRFRVVALALLFAVTVAGCGGGSSTSTADMDGDGMTMPEPTAYEKAKAAIAGAETAEDAQAAYDAVKDDVTAAEGETLQAAVDARVEAMMAMTRQAEQKQALMTAAEMVDTSDLSTAGSIDAARNAIAALQAALDAADDVSDADKAMYQTQLETAGEAVRMAQTGLDTAGRMMAQRMDISDAVTAARSAVNMVRDDATDAQVTAADNAVAALKAAIDGAEDLPEGDADVASAQGTLGTLGGQLSSAKTARMNAMDDTQRAADMAMRATAAKLYAGISKPVVKGVNAAAYGADNDNVVTIGEKDGVTLSEDKKTMVADNHGWAGKKYTFETTGGDTYEAVVYSNVGAATEGEKFSTLYLKTGVVAVEIQPGKEGRVASSSFDQSAGQKRFKLPDPNPNLAWKITVSGSYHGVSGTYSCTPSGDTCAADVAESGFRLGTVNSDGDFTFGSWTFTPTNPYTRVMEVADPNYALYGWWLRKSADGQAFTASAFVGVKGDVATSENIDDLNGKATYMGGAAGKYALSSSTGGTNDAGHFTARATLQADFTNNKAATAITGTIDQFVGADGESRDWEVELKGSAIGGKGVIGTGATKANGTEVIIKTVWTIGGTAADASGQWSGSLLNNGTDGVPQVATGTLYTEYGTAGLMVGAFGANKQ